MKLLDRYILRNFFEPFLICLGAFIAIWLIIDFSDNNNDFIQAHATWGQIGNFYLTQLPATVLLSLPIGLLLALLFSLSSMSRRNEIISMLTAGRSLSRVLLPLFVVGMLTSGLCLWLNWAQAPHAEGIRKNAIKLLKRGRKAGEAEALMGHVFRNRQDNRTWFVRKLRPGSNELDTVHITQQTDQGEITRKYYAKRAVYEPLAKTWILKQGMIAEFDLHGDITTTDYFPTATRTLADWSETPWRIASSQLDAGGLSVPELHSYLENNADFPRQALAPYLANLSDRYAWPLGCLVVVLIAAPLGIVFNRRGMLGSLFSALLLFVLLLLSRYLFLAFGKGDRISPTLSPWIPDLVGAAIGFVLLWFRSKNRDLTDFARSKNIQPTSISTPSR
ncbi:MAG: LptF/LptG family permease [Verrucomicrobiota bacterium]